jgi:hypothetical protein
MFVEMHVASLAADEGFVNLDFTVQLAPEGFILHSQTNPMHHEPCSFLSDIQITRNLATANPVLASGEQPQRSKPLVKADGGVLTKTSDLNGELALRVMFGASPSAALLAETYFIATASRTDHAVRPASDG